MSFFPQSWLDLLSPTQNLGAALLLLLAGRLILRGRDGPAVQLMAGWGAFCLLLTLWGVAGIGSLRIPAELFGLLAFGGLLVPHADGPGDRAGLLRVLVLALPILLITAPMRPSQPDIFLNLMPNAAYLVDHAAFPVDGGPASYSFLPVAPYNTQFVPFLGALLGGGFAASGLALFTVLLHPVAGLLYARILASRPDPGWVAAALGLLLATAFNPGFVPRVAFAGYGEAPLAIALLFAAWAALGAMAALAQGERWPPQLLALALVLAALVNTKQQALGLFLAVLAAAVLVASLDRRIGWWTALRSFVAAGIPGAILYLAWRWYVLTQFPEGELKPLPIGEWQWGNLPEIAVSMGKVILEKPFFFACVLAVFALLPRALRLRDEAPERMTQVRAVRLAVATFLAYNAFIVLTYIGHFPGEMSVEAHSYFRYNTQLSQLIVLALVLSLKTPVARFLAARRQVMRVLGTVSVALILLVPVALASRLRFDRDPPQPLVWGLAADLVPHLPAEGGRLALIMPGDNGSLAPMLRGILRFSAPRHPTLDLFEIETGGSAALDQAAAAGYDLAFITCTGSGEEGLPPNAAALLERRDGAWQTIESWPYPPVPPKQRWSQILASAPLCRP